jgi:hypothetical protein
VSPGRSRVHRQARTLHKLNIALRSAMMSPKRPLSAT